MSIMLLKMVRHDQRNPRPWKIFREFTNVVKAGMPMAEFVSSKCSVFASGWNHEHQSLLNMDPEWPFKYKPTGASSSIISNRVSWFFDLHGPSVTVDAACSSSMVALHLAAQSLQTYESEMVSTLPDNRKLSKLWAYT
jgi:acyl transferase domain-containing protein